MRNKISLRAAFDGGCGQRSISHRHENPYSLNLEPAMHAAWEKGWAATDAELNRQAEKAIAR